MLPHRYPEVESSLECPNCSAYAAPEVVRLLARKYPEAGRELVGNLATYHDAVMYELARRALPNAPAASSRKKQR